jgi:hypothetical protein
LKRPLAKIGFFPVTLFATDFPHNDNLHPTLLFLPVSNIKEQRAGLA